METIEKNLTTENSLKIIAETMERSRMTIAKNTGKPLILWGCMVALTSVVVYFLWSKTGSPVWNLLWFAMTAISVVCNIVMDRNKEKTPSTEISRIIGKTWMWFGIFTTGLYLMIWIAYFILRAFNPEASIHVDLTLVISLMMGLCGVISGVVMKMKSVVACLVIATALSVIVALVVNGPAQILVFAILGVIGLVIPGFILQNKAKNSQISA
ncbi:MAG: hypothetical protein IKS82_00405 [Bacteroidales bacterium]|nr:hypothetical protein [Bacteroidales bacterium]